MEAKEKNNYGFSVGGNPIHIKAEDEKTALLIFVNEHWDSIDDSGEIQLYGMVSDKEVLEF